MAKESAKKHCGAFVVMKSGKRYLFAPEAGTKVASVSGLVTAWEKDKEVFYAPLENVECWGGETWFFKDAWWGNQ